MTKTILAASGLLLATGLAVGTAGAQCTFPHPGKAPEIRLPLVQAFVPCDSCVTFTCAGGSNSYYPCASASECPGGTCSQPVLVGLSCAIADCAPPAFCHTQNASTDIGIASCNPPQTFNELAGSPANGWLWGPKGSGSIRFKAASNKIVSSLNPEPNTADVEVRIRLDDIRYANGDLVNGMGVVWPNRRTTFEDRVGGDMTVVDLSLPNFSVPVVNGRARVKTSANVFLNGANVKGVPGCSSLELVSLALDDENGTWFASPGIYVPDLPNQ